MGKWTATPKKNLKKVQKTTPSLASLASGKVPQKGLQQSLVCVVAPFANKAAIFTGRGGRGVLAEASDACSLWAILLIAGKDVGNFLHRLDQQLALFMEGRGITWDGYIDEHCVKMSTSNGYDPLNIGVKNWSRAFYFAVEEPSNEVVAMMSMLDDFYKWRLTSSPKAKPIRIQWVVPSSVPVTEDSLEYPSVELILSDEQVQEYLRDHLHEFESPTSAKHLIGVVEFQGQSGLITLYGDGYVHRQGLQDYAETVERDGRTEYVYSTGYVALVELPHHELITTCIDNRLTLLRPVPELPDVNAVRCWNALLDMPHLIGQKAGL